MTTINNFETKNPDIAAEDAILEMNKSHKLMPANGDYTNPVFRSKPINKGTMDSFTAKQKDMSSSVLPTGDYAAFAPMSSKTMKFDVHKIKREAVTPSNQSYSDIGFNVIDQSRLKKGKVDNKRKTGNLISAKSGFLDTNISRH